MSEYYDSAHATPAAANIPPNDAHFARQWLLEVWLTRLRWAGGLFALALVPLFPIVSPPLAVLLALGVALGNGALARLLRRGFCPTRLRRARRYATALEWLIALAAIGLPVRDPDNDVLIIVLPLILLSGTRHRLRGTLFAAVAAVLVVAGWLGLQVFLLQQLTATAAARDLAEWALAIGLTALVVGGQVQAGGEWFREEQARRARDWRAEEARRCQERARQVQQDAELQRSRTKLTRREWEVLQLVAQGLDDARIGATLSISPSTAKAHVYHISEKLGVTGRRAVADIARQHGWVAIEPEIQVRPHNPPPQS